MDSDLFDFQYELLRNGFNYDAEDARFLLQAAKACAKTAGLAMGAAGAVWMAGAGSVTVPGIGAVPGYVAGFLAGLVGGTAICTIQQVSMKRELDKLIQDSHD